MSTIDTTKCRSRQDHQKQAVDDCHHHVCSRTCQNPPFGSEKVPTDTSQWDPGCDSSDDFKYLLRMGTGHYLDTALSEMTTIAAVWQPVSTNEVGHENPAILRTILPGTHRETSVMRQEPFEMEEWMCENSSKVMGCEPCKLVSSVYILDATPYPCDQTVVWVLYKSTNVSMGELSKAAEYTGRYHVKTPFKLGTGGLEPFHASVGTAEVRGGERADHFEWWYRRGPGPCNHSAQVNCGHLTVNLYKKSESTVFHKFDPTAVNRLGRVTPSDKRQHVTVETEGMIHGENGYGTLASMHEETVGSAPGHDFRASGTQTYQADAELSSDKTGTDHDFVVKHSGCNGKPTGKLVLVVANRGLMDTAHDTKVREVVRVVTGAEVENWG